jgi:hypothetical protein
MEFPSPLPSVEFWQHIMSFEPNRLPPHGWSLIPSEITLPIKHRNCSGRRAFEIPVQVGDTLNWTFAVKAYDISFRPGPLPPIPPSHRLPPTLPPFPPSLPPSSSSSLPLPLPLPLSLSLSSPSPSPFHLSLHPRFCRGSTPASAVAVGFFRPSHARVGPGNAGLGALGRAELATICARLQSCGWTGISSPSRLRVQAWSLTSWRTDVLLSAESDEIGVTSLRLDPFDRARWSGRA